MYPNNNMILTATVFNSPDKNSITEIKYRAFQNLVKVKSRGLNLIPDLGLSWDQLAHGIPMPPVTRGYHPMTVQGMSMPPAGYQIPESLVREIMAIIKQKYPWAEALLASRMSKEQFQLFLDKIPELKHIITSRMPVMPPQVFSAPTPDLMRDVANAAAAAMLARSARGPPKRDVPQEKFSLKFIELLFQVKKVCEVGLLDEEILTQPLSPVTMSMVNSLVMQVKKLAEARRALLAGKLKNPDDELAIRKRLLEMKEYIREEQKLYIESLKKTPEAERETLEDILKRL